MFVYMSVCVCLRVWREKNEPANILFFFFFFYFLNFRGRLMQQAEPETVIFSKLIHTKSGDLKLQEIADD